MKIYYLNRNKKLDVPSIQKEKQRRLDLEKRLGYKLSDNDYLSYKRKFGN